MSSLKRAALFICILSEIGIPLTVSLVMIFILSVIDVLRLLFQTDNVQTFIREREKTKRHELRLSKKRQKKNHMS